ncbi:uncharacterized protein [Eurosta solidaginis]
MVLRLGAIPCINKNGRSRTKIQKEKLNDYQEKNERCESSYLNDTNTSEDLKSAYALEIYHVNEPINIKYEKDDDPFVHNITNTKDILKTDFDIKYEHEYSNSQENNSISAQTNDNIVTEVEYGATAEAFIINEDSCCSAASESMANKVNGRAIKRKLSPTETIEWLREGPTFSNTTNHEQFKRLVNMMTERPDIVLKYRGNSKVNIQNFWDDVTNQLNMLGPPCKSSKAWRKVWVDYKSHIRRKLSLNKAPENERQCLFSDLEETVIKICRFESSTSLSRNLEISNCRTASEEMVTFPPKMQISEDASDGSMQPAPADDMSSDSRRKDNNSFPSIIVSNTDPASDVRDITSQNFREVTLPSQKQQKYDTATQALLQKQISIQEHFYKKSIELSKRNNKKLDEIATNLETLSKANKYFAKTQANMLHEMRRHNRVMEDLKREQIDRTLMLERHNL